MPTKANEFSISQGLEGFLLAKAAEGRGPKTIRDYSYCLGMFVQWLYVAMHRQGAGPEESLSVSKDGRNALAVNGLSQLRCTCLA